MYVHMYILTYTLLVKQTSIISYPYIHIRPQFSYYIRNSIYGYSYKEKWMLSLLQVGIIVL